MQIWIGYRVDDILAHIDLLPTTIAIHWGEAGSATTNPFVLTVVIESRILAYSVCGTSHYPACTGRGHKVGAVLTPVFV